MFREGGRLVGTSSVKKTRFGEVGRVPGGSGGVSSDCTVIGDTGASVNATRFGDWGRGFGDERAAGEAGGMPSEKATRFGDLTEYSSEPSETSEMWLRRLEETLVATAAASPPRGASRRGALIASGAAGAPPAGATF